MNAILRGIDHVFDFVFRFLGLVPPLLALAVLAVPMAIVALLVFRWISNQKAIRRAKDRIGAHVLEIRLFPDQLSVVARAYLAMLGSTFLYLRHALRPVAVLFVPVFFLFVQMEAYFEHKPLPVSQNFLLRAVVAKGQDVNDLQIELPSGLELTAPPVHIPDEREVDWRLNPRRQGAYELRLRLRGTEYTKRIVAGSGLRRVNSERRRGGLWQTLLSQAEAPLPETGALEGIAVQYPPREIAIWKWEFNWVWVFLVLMLGSALALKNVVGVEL